MLSMVTNSCDYIQLVFHQGQVLCFWILTAEKPKQKCLISCCPAYERPRVFYFFYDFLAWSTSERIWLISVSFSFSIPKNISGQSWQCSANIVCLVFMMLIFHIALVYAAWLGNTELSFSLWCTSIAIQF